MVNKDVSEGIGQHEEATMKSKEEELNVIIAKLESKVSFLKESLAKEESEKLREKEARMALEKTQDSLREELGWANEKVKTQEQYNAGLKKVESSMVAYTRFLSVYNRTLLESLDDAIKQKEAAKEEVDILRIKLLENLEHCNNRHLLVIQDLISRLRTFQERTGAEDTCSSQREQISILQHQLAEADQKLKMAEMSSAEQIEEQKRIISDLQGRLRDAETQISILQHQLAEADQKLEMAEMSSAEQIEEQKRIISDLQGRLRDAEIQILEGENLRKKLHNTILELKGNIRVFCRVRPLLPEEDGPAAEAAVSFPSSAELAGRGIDLYQSGQKYSFTFDKVFDHNATQQEVFMEISQLVQSALDGYKVCIFAYGQTGSGKTYTMMGCPEAPQQKGLMPRSLEQVFQTSQALAAEGWKYKMQASVLEIYNESIHDLLSPRTSNRADAGGAGKQYVIRHAADGNTYVSDLTVVDVCSETEVSNLLQQAAHSRSVGKTAMNEQSSRSHLVFTLRIYGVNESTRQEVQGVLNLIDLACSQRLSKTEATGEQLKETQAINKSLSSLGDVIFALARKEDYVPFRNSKLTYLLQPCLGRDSKTLMFVNVSPNPSSVGESLCSLRFAATVNSCPRR